MGNQFFKGMHPFNFFSVGISTHVPNNFSFRINSETESFFEISNVFKSSFKEIRLESIDFDVFNPRNLDRFNGFSNGVTVMT
jgi:hypothetical protein